MSGINPVDTTQAQGMSVLSQEKDGWLLVDVNIVQTAAKESFELLAACRDAVGYIDCLLDEEEEYVMVNKDQDIDEDPEQLGDGLDWEMDMETEIEGLTGGKVEEEDYIFVPMQGDIIGVELI